MRGHDTQLERLLILLHILMALREHRPGRCRAGLDANDLEHDSQCLGEIPVDIRLVSVPDQSAYFKRQRRADRARTLLPSESAPEISRAAYLPPPFTDPRSYTKVVPELGILGILILDPEVPVLGEQAGRCVFVHSNVVDEATAIE